MTKAVVVIFLVVARIRKPNLAVRLVVCDELTKKEISQHLDYLAPIHLDLNLLKCMNGINTS